MRFEIAVHTQSRRMRSDLSQQSAFDKKPQIVIDRSQRNRWNATPDRGVNVFWRMMSVRSDDCFIYHLTLVRDRQTVSLGQLTEVFMGETHDYRMRMIINERREVEGGRMEYFLCFGLGILTYGFATVGCYGYAGQLLIAGEIACLH
jgi:hypothetical protein